MKKIILLASALSVTSLSAVQYTITNFDGATFTDAAIADDAGNLLAANSGYVGIGTFTGGDAAVNLATSIMDLDSAFSELGSSQVVNGFGAAGIIQSTIVFANPTSTAPIYIIIGNGSSLLGSTSFLVYNTGENLTPDGIPVQDSDLEIRNDSGLLVGDFGTFQADAGLGTADVFSLEALATIPEPTSTMLLALGSFAFVIRRRR